MGSNVTWCDGLVRLSPVDGAVLDGDGESAQTPPVRLRAMRNGFGAAQLAVGPLEKGAVVTVDGGALAGPDGASLRAAQWDVFVAWYVQVDGKWLPDALVPQAVTGGSTPVFRRENGVPGQRVAGFWLDLFVPADAKPGCYTGEVAVVVGKERTAVPVEVEVAAVVLPTRSTLDVSMNNYADGISAAFPAVRDDPRRFWGAKYRRIERGVFRAAHDHRTFLHYLPYTHSGYIFGDFAPPLAGEGTKRRVTSWTDWDKHFGPYFDGSAFAGTRLGAAPVKRFWLPLNLTWPSDFTKFGRPGYAAEWRAVGKQMADHFRKKDWTGTCFDMFLNHKQRYRFFPWDAEECRFLPDQDLHRYVRTFWEGAFDWKTTQPVKFQYTLGTTWTYGFDIRSDLAQFIDVFIAGTDGPAWFPEETARLRAEGRQVWSCTHAGSIADSPRATSYVALMAWMRDLGGIMPRWLSLGGWGADPWVNPPDKGGTTFFYPGARFETEETYPSLRLKVLRDAIQVVDALQLAVGGGDAAPIKERVNQVIGFKSGDWYPKRPAYVTEKKPKDWTGADFATEEPPLAGWRQIGAPMWRQLQSLASELAATR
jgi:hypothetical protein